MDEIYLHGKTDRLGFIPCALTDKSRHHQGKTLWEIDQVRKDERQRQAKHEPRALQARINLTDTIKGIVAEAQEMRPDHSDKSKSERTKSIRKNRRDEKQEERNSYHAPERKRNENTVKGEVLPFPGVKPEEDYSLPDITEIFRRFGKETGDDGTKK